MPGGELANFGIGIFAVAALAWSVTTIVVKVFAARRQPQLEQTDVVKVIQEITTAVTALTGNIERLNELVTQQSMVITEVRLSLARIEGRQAS